MEQKEKYDVLDYDTTKPEQLLFSNTHNKYIYPSKTYDWISRVQNKYNLPIVTEKYLKEKSYQYFFKVMGR